jgi:NAD(P)-dependent dehydrogenase (short-subunit alcohol dehydrogenase family)
MKESSIAGSIILTSSVYGIVPQRNNLYEGTNLNENIIYPSMKAGINHHCKQMASYYGPDGIRVNSLSPGGLKGEIAGKNQKQDKEFIKNYEEMTALKRMCYPEDLVGAYLFLSSDSSSYITGQNLVIDGGFHLA